MGRFFLVFLSILAFSFGSIYADGSKNQDDDSEYHNVFDAGNTAFHHISDANVYSIGPWSIPLPCFLYAPGHGWSVFSSSKFDIVSSHGDGAKAVDGYVLNGGSVMRVQNIADFPKGEVELISHSAVEKLHDAGKHVELFHHKKVEFTEIKDGKEIKKEKEVTYFTHDHKDYILDAKSTGDGGLFGGGITSYYDFSLTKNVVSMLIVCLLLMWLFISVARTYTRREGKAPKGMQGFIEPIFVFIQDEVAKPFLGKNWEKHLPLLMSLFFFILALNLFGQIPFFGGSNVTGNISVTLVLAVIAFLVTNLNGNKHYWEHIAWMPGVPAILKILIITPVEIIGMFIKPITLALRLFANITAGHMVLVIFVGLIFMFGESGANPGMAYGTAIGSTLLTLFMMAIELLVAFIQAFVFTILTASYIGAATEEAHH